jgi:hypothetical protein
VRAGLTRPSPILFTKSLCSERRLVVLLIVGLERAGHRAGGGHRIMAVIRAHSAPDCRRPPLGTYRRAQTTLARVEHTSLNGSLYRTYLCMSLGIDIRATQRARGAIAAYVSTSASRAGAKRPARLLRFRLRPRL